MATYLVTGGCGFIGSHLVDKLINLGHKIRVLDNLSTGFKKNIPPECELIIGDITDEKTIKASMEGVDGCFHLGAISSVQESNEHWLKAHKINLTGSINVFNAARKHKTPVVYASSAAVYGDNADMPLNEKAELRPLTAYGADKLATELHARVASLVHGIPTTGLRLFNVYGPRQSLKSPYTGVVTSFLMNLTQHLPLTIFGDGEQVRDFIYVDDVVEVMVKAMEHIDSVPSVYNVCTGESISINKLSKMMLSISRRNVDILRAKTQKGDIRVSIGDSKRCRQAYKLTRYTPLVDGLRKLITAAIAKA